jgi:hypothetical protein
MKIKPLKLVVRKHKQRSVVALLFVCLISLALITGSAQLRNQKHLVALQLGDAAEGSRVTIVSDSALNDYEAFRRGDSFYVKIPLADFNAAFPQLRADGFEAVHVQKVADNVVISFKLQPGATARVEQGSNRLEVIFSSPNRSARNAPANRATSASNSARTTPDRGPDRAGPMPGGSELAFRPRLVTPGTADGFGSRASQNSRLPIKANVDSSKNSNRGGQASNGNATVKSASPVPSSTAVLSSATAQTHPPLTRSSPGVSPVSNAGPNSAGPSASPGSANFKTQGNRVGRWIASNRLAALLGALILLALILYLVLGLRRRGEDGGKANRLKAMRDKPKAQPKVESGVESTPSPEAQAAEVERATSLAAPAAHHSSVLTKPSIAAPVAGQYEQGEEEEREVFEL